MIVGPIVTGHTEDGFDATFDFFNRHGERTDGVKYDKPVMARRKSDGKVFRIVEHLPLPPMVGMVYDHLDLIVLDP